MASIFSKIAKGEIPSYKIAENEKYFAFLDINPLVKGHTLVIPKKENDYIFDLSSDDYIGLWLFAKEIAIAIEKAIPCKRIGIAVVGLEVPHTHIHLIPLQSGMEIDFSRTKLTLSPEDLNKISENICSFL